MRKELELKLQNEFPFMRSDCPWASYNFKTVDYIGGDSSLHSMTGSSNYETYEIFGCECSDGWYDIIRGLCLDIVKAYEEAGLEIDLKPMQIKEKFGALRFYYCLSETEESPISMDFLGVGRMILGETKSDIGGVIREIVSKWEKASIKTCERCGAPGELRNLSWIQTLCDSCYETRKQGKVKDYKPTWRCNYDGEGMLTISGTGEMEFYTTQGNRFDGDCREAFGDDKPLIKTVVIKDGITSIGAGAFSECRNLASVSIPESVTYIGSSVFRNCASLTDIKIPDGITIINSRLFMGCTSLRSVNIPRDVTLIANDAFSGCSALTEIKLPEGLRYIGSSAFQSCTALTDVNIPASVEDIGINVFTGCRNLKNIHIEDPQLSIQDGSSLVKGGVFLLRYFDKHDTDSYAIPNGIVTIERSAFAECEGLTSIHIPESVNCIRENAFWGCKNLTKINIPDNVKKISGGTFHSCKSLQSITLHAGLTYIDSWAFGSCDELAELVIPESIEGIGYHAFDNCPNLVICCRENSPAHKYAVKNEIKSKLM